MKPNLYICHTAYQVLVDLLRASRTDGQPHTMVLSAAVPEPQSRAKKLEATGAVKVVIVDETRWPGTVTGPFAPRRARRAFEKLCGWRFTRAAYNEVRIHNDWSVLGRYLQDCHAGYILCEDTFASTLGPDQHASRTPCVPRCSSCRTPCRCWNTSAGTTRPLKSWAASTL